MPLLLTTTRDDLPSQRLMLRSGQCAHVGRSELAEFSVPNDRELADSHFVVQCRASAIIESLGEELALVCDGESTSRIEFSDPMHQPARFIAGSTEFNLLWTPDVAIQSTRETDDDSESDTEPVDDSERIGMVAEKLKLSADAIALIQTPDVASDFVSRLIQQGCVDDALVSVAGLLPVVDAVVWASELQASGELPSGELPSGALPSGALIDAVRTWTGDVTEESRLAVKQIVEGDATDDGRLKWIAMAVVYSGGSLAPEGQAVVPPPEHLSAIAVSSSVRFALAAQEDREEAKLAWATAGLDRLRSRISNE